MKELFELFITFLKIGLFTIGGGYAMIPQIKESVIEKKHWLNEEEMLDIIAIAESTPGPIAINTATYVGYKQKKILGSIFATLGIIFPSLVIIIILSFFYNKFIDNKYVQYAFIGIKCSVSFIILKAGIELSKQFKKNLFAFILIFIVIILMLLFEIFNVNFSSVYFILFGGLIGIVYNAINKKRSDNI